jgi:hypothetical protein
MLRVASPSVVRRIESLFDSGCVSGLADRQLIEQFTARCDANWEAAFAALVGCCASAGKFCATVTTPKTSFRPCSWSLPAEHGRFTTPSC